MKPFQLLYLFDPLCGWCYASAPALEALARVWPAQLKLLPSGLFSGVGARDMTAEWANYAWTNDQRIGAMTGQVFSERYHHEVLLRPTLRFDSTVMNRALTCAGEFDSALEPRLLHALQIARYVNGLDTASFEVVGKIASQVVNASGFELLEDRCIELLRKDDALAQLTQARTLHTQAVMNELSVRGVPQLLFSAGSAVRQLPSPSLYLGGDVIVSEVQSLLDAAVAESAQPTDELSAA